jgi:hypothetical protein
VLATALVAAMLPPDREVLPIGSSYGVSNAVPGRYAMLTGDLQVTVGPDLGPDGAVIDVWQGAGTVSVTPLEGTAVRLTASSENGDMWIVTEGAQAQEWAVPEGKQLVDGRWEWTQTFGDPTAEPVDVRVEQGAGSIVVHDTAAASSDTGGTDGTPDPSTEGTPGLGTVPGATDGTDPATITTPQTTSEDAP